MHGEINSSYIILMMAAICIVFMLAIVFQRQLKFILQFVLRGILGGIGIVLINFLLAFAGINIGVGINFLSFLIVGALGIPGFITLYFTGLLL